MRKLATLTAALLLAATVTAQEAKEAKKPLSPPATATAVLGGRNVTIDYSAPSKRERVIMGGLVPYGALWRTGANAATTLTTDGDLMIGTLHVPAGKYALLTIPNEKEWTLVVSRQTDLRGTNGYDQAQDLGRVPMKVTGVKKTVETFAIALETSGKKTGTLTLTWENTQASVPVTVH